MSSDTDSTSSTGSSDSSSSTDDYKKRKSSKKHKRNSEKKHKKQKKQKKQHKEKKRAKFSAPPIAAVTAPALVYDDDYVPAFGPALPPPNSIQNSPATTVIGPALPSGLLKQEHHTNKQNEPKVTNDVDDDEGLNFGPLPVDGSNMTSTEIEREQRALELKIAAMEGRGFGQGSSDQKSREEWMLELPDVGLRGGLASLSNMKRTFYAGKEKPDFSDRSSWTKTPQSQNGGKQQPSTSKKSIETLRSTAEARYERERDAEQERMAKKHKKKHKREESLVDIHQKKLKKEKKQKEKELAANGAKPERRPFTRDVDLKLNKIDSNQTKQIVDKAKILNTKFSSGKSKYL